LIDWEKGRFYQDAEFSQNLVLNCKVNGRIFPTKNPRNLKLPTGLPNPFILIGIFQNRERVQD